MVSFADLWDKIPQKINEEEDSKALAAIKIGLNVSESFWDNFMLVANDREGLAELLDVTPEQVAMWPIKIKENLDKVGPPSPDKTKTKLLDTGEFDLGEQ